MKKLLTMFMAAVMCLSLVACGGGEITSSETEKKYTSVEISDDNWEEYLEFDSVHEVFWKESVFEDESPELDYIEIGYRVAVKDEYYNILDVQNSNIAVKLSFDMVSQYGTYSEDYSSFEPSTEFKLIAPLELEFLLEDTGTAFEYKYNSARATKLSVDDGCLEKYAVNQNVLRIEGTLVIAE